MSQKTLTAADAKALAMGARTESLRIALVQAAEASKAASSVTFAMASESGRGWDPDAHLMPVAQAILAAYQRGLEDAARLAETWGSAPPNPRGRRAALAAAIRALAAEPPHA